MGNWRLITANRSSYNPVLITGTVGPQFCSKLRDSHRSGIEVHCSLIFTCKLKSCHVPCSAHVDQESLRVLQEVYLATCWISWESMRIGVSHLINLVHLGNLGVTPYPATQNEGKNLKTSGGPI